MKDAESMVKRAERTMHSEHKAPRFQHDCARCVYLGRHDFHTRGVFHRYDLYWCAHPSTPNLSSLIARYGDGGPEYRSSHPPEAFCVGFEPNDIERVILARAVERSIYKPWDRKQQLEGALRNAIEDLESGYVKEALAMLKAMQGG